MSYQKNLNLMLAGKAVTIAVGIVTLILYCKCYFRSEGFLAALLVALILSSTSFALYFKKEIRNNTIYRWTDMVFHCFAGLFLLYEGISFIFTVVRLASASNNIMKKLFAPDEFVLEIDKAEGFATGIFAACNGVVYAIVTYLIWQWHSSEATATSVAIRK